MEIIIISGRSGAGKSVALRALEDMGYYCVDNLPLDLLPQLTNILAKTQTAVAISLDIRNLPHSSADLDKILTDIQATYSVKIIFLDSDRSTLISRYGIPLDADYVFDVRFLPNPHWNPELRPMTGLDEPVAQFLLAHDEVNNFIYQTRNYIETWLPMLEQNNRSYLTIAIGCTGGKHRSVYIAQQIGEYFQAKGKNVKIQHKSLEKNKKN